MSEQSLKPGWKMVKFGDIAQNVAVRVDPADAKTDVYVGLEHLDPSTLHLRQWGQPSDVTGQKLAFKKGDVIFGRRRAYQRKLAVAEFDGICSAHAMVVRAKPKMILPEFLPFFLQSDMFMERAIEISVGSLSPTINWKTLKVQEFPLPPLDEQKRIAKILWAADETMEFFAKAYLHCETMQGALIDDLIIKNNSHQNFIALGKLIHGKPQYGANAPASEFQNDGLRYIRITDINSNGLLNQEEKVGVRLGNDDEEKYLLMHGDVLFARTGNTVGKVYLHSEQNEKCVYAGYLVRFKPNTKKLLPDYLFLFTRSSYYKKWIDNTVRVGAQPNINGQEYSTLPIFLPPIETQIQLVEKSKTIGSVKGEVLRHIASVRRLSKALMEGYEHREGAAHV